MKDKKILVICASGIGNTILFTPTLRTLRKGLPRAKITLLVTKSVFAEPVRGSAMVDEIVVFDDGKSLLEKTKIIIKLRRKKIDCSITAFPSNRWQFNVFAFLAGAKKRITHGYKVGRFKTLSFLQNVKVPADENLHDVNQNLNLLKPLRISLPEKKKFLFYLSEKERKSAEKFWKENNFNGSFVIGIHPGSAGIQQDAKRWPAENFAELCNQLIKEKNAQILIFGGKEEKELKDKIKSLINNNHVYIVNASPKKVAAIIKKCNLFISNDSGLMHVATVLGVKTIGIFGPTNYQRTTPYGKNCYIIRKDLPCSPCLKYPFYSILSEIDCPRKFECLEKLQIEDVFNNLKGVLDEKG